jgi:hypothetical protein
MSGFYVSCLSRKFGGTENLLDVLIKGVYYRDDGYIAEAK